MFSISQSCVRDEAENGGAGASAARREYYTSDRSRHRVFLRLPGSGAGATVAIDKTWGVGVEV